MLPDQSEKAAKNDLYQLAHPGGLCLMAIPYNLMHVLIEDGIAEPGGIISVAHRLAVTRYHSRYLILAPDDEGRVSLRAA